MDIILVHLQFNIHFPSIVKFLPEGAVRATLNEVAEITWLVEGKSEVNIGTVTYMNTTRNVCTTGQIQRE